MGKNAFGAAVALVVGLGITVDALAQSSAGFPPPAEPAPAAPPPVVQPPPPVVQPPPPVATSPSPAAAPPAQSPAAAPPPVVEPPPPAEAPPSAVDPQTGAPKARVGFQMAIRTGYALPMGKVLDSTGVSDMSDFVSAQVPVIFDIGGKVIPEVFVGGYLGFAFGGAAGFEETRCGTNCASARLILGIEAQYHILPAGQMNPWLGYGIGLESTAVGGKIAGEDESVAFAGWEFAHFMGGLDVRLSRVFGIGPFVDFSLGSYSTQSTKSQGVTRNFDVNQTALHEWFTIGARGVFFP